MRHIKQMFERDRQRGEKENIKKARKKVSERKKCRNWGDGMTDIYSNQELEEVTTR